MRQLLFLISVAFAYGAEQIDPIMCKKKGYSKGLMCSSCNELEQFRLGELVASCRDCCQEDVSEMAKVLYPYAEIVVCSWKLGKFPQIQAFLSKSERFERFPRLTMRNARGSDPFLVLQGENREAKETLSIDKWNTDSLEEFLTQHLQS